VRSESRKHGIEWQNSTQVSAERSADRGKTGSLFLRMPRFFDVSAHRDPIRLEACFENGHQWRSAIDTEG